MHAEAHVSGRAHNRLTSPTWGVPTPSFPDLALPALTCLLCVCPIRLRLRARPARASALLS
eukprot:6011752-Pleurochrysis_carterae.AAC.2